MMFLNPGSTIAGLLGNIAIGDSVAPRGSDVSSVTYGANSLIVVTNLGTTTFSNVSYSGTEPTGFTVTFLSTSGTVSRPASRPATLPQPLPLSAAQSRAPPQLLGRTAGIAPDVRRIIRAMYRGGRLIVFPKRGSKRFAEVAACVHSSSERSGSPVDPPLWSQRSLLRCDQRPLRRSPPRVEIYWAPAYPL
jgi:hypothetical protein